MANDFFPPLPGYPGTGLVTTPIAEGDTLFGFDSAAVPDIDFCVKDASLVQSDVISNYEKFFFAATQIRKTLARGDPVRLFLLSNIYQIIRQRSIADSTGKQNLIKYSVGPNLDNIGARWGPTRGRRLPASKAKTILRFTLSAAQGINVVVPEGTLVQTYDEHQFATDEDLIILTGEVDGEVSASAVEAGEEYSGFVPGQINDIVQIATPFVVEAVNLTTSMGGFPAEEDPRYRARIWMAPESFSVAGPYGAYEYHTASVSQDIETIEIFGDPRIPGQVWIYFLMKGGRLPTLDEKQQVLDLYHPPNGKDNIRPLTDLVSTPNLEIILFVVNATYYIDYDNAVFAAEIMAKAEVAYQEYLTWQQGKINRDIVPNKLTQLLMNAGIKRVEYRWTNPAPPAYEPMQTGFTNVPSPGFLGCAIARLDPISPGLIYGGIEAQVLPAPPPPAP